MHRVVFFFTLVGALSAQVANNSTASIQVTSGDNQATAPNSTFYQPVTVLVTNPQGAPLAGVTVTFSVPAATAGVAGGAFVGGAQTATATTNAFGFATSPKVTTASPLGTFQETASLGGVSAKAKLNVTGNPANVPPTVSPDYLSYFMVIGDKAPAQQTLSVTPGTGDVQIVSDSPWLKFNQRSLYFVDVTVDPTGLAAGYYEGRLTFSQVNYVRVFFTIQAKPSINSSVTTMTFNYGQYTTVVPFKQDFWIGSSVRNYAIDVAVKYTNPATGNWLAVASTRGMVTPIKLTAVVDPRGMNPGTYVGAIQILGDASNSPFAIPVTLVVAPFNSKAPGPRISSFANAASKLDGAIAAGEMVSLGGDNLSCESTPTVLVDGDAAQVLSAGASEIRLIVPDSVSGKNRVPVQYTCGGASSDLFTVPVQYASPALFTRASTQALAFNDDDSLNTEAAPAARGSVVTLFATGLGALDTPDADGMVPFLAPLSFTVGGEAAEVLSAVRAADMPGAVRIKLRLSRNVQPGSEVDVRIQSGLEAGHATIVVN